MASTNTQETFKGCLFFILQGNKNSLYSVLKPNIKDPELKIILMKTHMHFYRLYPDSLSPILKLQIHICDIALCRNITHFPLLSFYSKAKATKLEGQLKIVLFDPTKHLCIKMPAPLWQLLSTNLLYIWWRLIAKFGIIYDAKCKLPVHLQFTDYRLPLRQH